MGPFTRDETAKLVRKLTSGQAGPDRWPLIHDLTGGHPFYITALCRRLLNLVEEYLSPDGQAQLDALAEAVENQKWAVEVKWRNKRVGPKELERLFQRARSLSAQAWCISKAGFSGEALTYARRHKIRVSDAEAIEALEALLKV